MGSIDDDCEHTVGKKNVHKIQNINKHNTRETRLKKLNRWMVCIIMGGGIT